MLDKLALMKGDALDNSARIVLGAEDFSSRGLV